MERTAKQRSSCVKLKKATLRCTTICLNQPEKLHKWSNESMLGDLKVVKEGRMGVNRAALSYGVPRTTLKDRVTGRVLHCSNVSPQPYLTTEEEKELVNFLITSNKMGYGKTRRLVLKIVETTVWFSLLTTEEETELVDFLITSSKMGYGKTIRQVLKIVEAAVWFSFSWMVDLFY